MVLVYGVGGGGGAWSVQERESQFIKSESWNEVRNENIQNVCIYNDSVESECFGDLTHACKFIPNLTRKELDGS